MDVGRVALKCDLFMFMQYPFYFIYFMKNMHHMPHVESHAGTSQILSLHPLGVYVATVP